MAFVSSFNISLSLRGTSATSSGLNLKLLVTKGRPNQTLTTVPSSRSVLTFARRKNPTAITSSSSKKKKDLVKNDVKEEEEGDIDEDAFEALFKQLEEDLKNDDPSFLGDEDEEMSEEELAKLEYELAEVLGEDDDLLQMFKSTVEGMERNDDLEVEDDDEEEEEGDSGEKEDEEGEEDDEEEELLKLKNWQLRRLASALKTGRRKTSIKSLAGELCLDRAIVLKLLRDPPPKLLLMSAALPDKPMPVVSEPEAKPAESASDEETKDLPEPEAKVNEPVHIMQSRWSAQKRLKKVQVETLERVYRRTKRPTNAMISSIVHVTNLPRKRVVKWFEDKRGEDGVPVHRLPYQRSAPKTVFS